MRAHSFGGDFELKILRMRGFRSLLVQSVVLANDGVTILDTQPDTTVPLNL